MKRIKLLCFTVGALGIAMMHAPASHAWYNDPNINTPVAPSAHNQIDHSAIPDGAGGAIITWAENIDQTSTGFDIYAQRIDSYGNPMWAQPAAICTAPDYQGLPRILSDGVGGAIIVWHDSRGGMNDSYSNFDIYAQRVSGDGRILWAQDGIPVSTAPSWQVFPHMTQDGAGGVIISWDDGRSGNSQVYAQRVSRDGQVLWGPDGVLVADLGAGQSDSDIAADGFGGAVVVWNDYRALDNMDIYAQRLDSNGKKLWGAQGLALCTMVGNQFAAHAISDGLGGGIFSWADDRAGSGEVHIYAQRVDSAGTIVWAAQGIPVTADVPGSQVTNALVRDGVGGAVIVWEDGRKKNGDTDIYAQRITTQGVPLWTAGGVPVATADNMQIRPSLIPDGSGGAFIAWQDFYRDGVSWNIFAQHITGSGEAAWKKDGVAVSTADGIQSDPFIISDSSGGTIIIWYDGRQGALYNIYAQRVNQQGLLGGGEFMFYTADTSGNPRTVFSPGELILFRATWVEPAPQLKGTYQAESAMVIHSNQGFRQQSVTYDVQ